MQISRAVREEVFRVRRGAFHVECKPGDVPMPFPVRANDFGILEVHYSSFVAFYFFLYLFWRDFEQKFVVFGLKKGFGLKCEGGSVFLLLFVFILFFRIFWSFLA
jgi:hypothetical protein